MTQEQQVQAIFVKPWRGYAKGAAAVLKVSVAKDLQAGGYIEANIADPPKQVPQVQPNTTHPLTPGGTVVEYDLQEMVNDLQATIEQKEDELTVARERIINLEAKLKEANATIAELSGEPAEVPAVTPPTSEQSTQDTSTAEEVSWEGQPVAASSAIPSNLKGLLLQNQIALMGDLAKAVDENTLTTIDGIGEAKAADLKGVIEALRSE